MIGTKGQGVSKQNGDGSAPRKSSWSEVKDDKKFHTEGVWHLWEESKPLRYIRYNYLFYGNIASFAQKIMLNILRLCFWFTFGLPTFVDTVDGRNPVPPMQSIWNPMIPMGSSQCQLVNRIYEPSTVLHIFASLGVHWVTISMVVSGSQKRW